jgi:hypothetical protein
MFILMHTSYHKQRQETTFPFANEEKKHIVLGIGKHNVTLELYTSLFLNDITSYMLRQKPLQPP